MYAERHVVEATTDAAGTATVFSPVVTGRVLHVLYQKAASDGFEDGVDFDITAEATGQTIWKEDNVNASAAVSPVTAAQLTTGADSTLTETPIVLANDRVKVEISDGGSGKKGTFVVVVG